VPLASELTHGVQTHGAAAICNRDDWLLQAGFASTAPQAQDGVAMQLLGLGGHALGR
jgi:hypothetical protein